MARGNKKEDRVSTLARVRTQQTYKISRSNIDQLTDYPHARTHTHTLRDFLSFPRRIFEISHGHFLSQELCSNLQHTTPVLTMYEEEKRNHNKPSIKTTFISVYCLLHVSASV